MTRIRLLACAFLGALLAPGLATASECRTTSGVTFQASAATARAFSMAVKGCGAVAARAPAPAAAAPLSPFLRLSEAPAAETSVAVRADTAAAGRRPIRILRAPVRSVAAPMHYAPVAGGGALYGVARAYNIDPAFLGSVVQVESGANPQARSKKGALGLMQVMPSTARRFGVASPGALANPTANLAVGAAYLKSLQRRYGNNLPLILAAYNAGEGAVARYHRAVPPYRETTGYVAGVLGRYRSALVPPARAGGNATAAAMR